MGHISFPWSYIFWRSTSLGLPCKSNPTPTTKMEKIAIFTTSILAEGTGKTHSKRHGCAVLPPFYQKQYHWFIAWIHQRGCSQFFFLPDSTWRSSFIRRSISNPHVSCSSSSTYRPRKISSCAWVNPWVKTCSSSPIFRNENTKTLWNLKIISFKKVCKSANRNLKKILKSYNPDYNL